MKFGVLFNQNNLNIGDDIQAYATARFLPRIDYFVDREHIDEFVPDTDEPVAVIMNAWYMWNKWNWPPSRHILPLMIGFHYADHQLAKQTGTPVKYEFLTGLGGEYLKAYGPVGCRDYFTMEQLQNIGIDAFFTGCVTMTLPSMPERPDKGTYVCLVDLDPKVEKKMKELLADSGLEIRVMTHNRERDINMSWEERKALVEDYLTTYQNARCVVTKRLHCSLPCLALKTPVYLIKGMDNDIRFTPYYDLLYFVRTNDFLAEDFVCDYDFRNPPANKPDYLKYREDIIRRCEEFVDSVKGLDGDYTSYVKTDYTDTAIALWRHDLMKKALDDIFIAYRDEQVKTKQLTARVRAQSSKLNKQERELAEQEEKYEGRMRELEELRAYKKEQEKKILNRLKNKLSK